LQAQDQGSDSAYPEATCRFAELQVLRERLTQVDQAAIQLDGDWAEVSVPRCSGTSAGADEFRLLYFEER
jgi:hypothetical protein